MSMKRGKRNRTFSLVSCLVIGFDVLRVRAFCAHAKTALKRERFAARIVLAFDFCEETAVCHLRHFKRHLEILRAAHLTHLFIDDCVDFIAMLLRFEHDKR